MSRTAHARARGVLRSLAPFVAAAGVAVASATLAVTVPNEVQQPGTQPQQVGPLTTSVTCSACHGYYDPAVEPYHNWSGSMMAQAGRDPLTWAAIAVAERGFDGAGDLCLRCHAPIGWLDGRSTPTDGSALVDDDFDGVSCEVCHRLVDPDDSEHIGVQTPPFIANNGVNPPEAYRGGAQAVLWGGSELLGPFSNAQAPHSTLPSLFHRRSDLCGTCHDVSNPVTGDLAPNNGAMTPLAPGTFDGTLGGPLAAKAAFNNFPFAYGVIERTYSEHMASPFEDLPVSHFRTLPAELRQGALRAAYEAAIASTPTGDYEDGAPRYFTCQTCHMKPVAGFGCALGGVPYRTDVPKHDLTGGNYWAPDAILYLDTGAQLVGGNGLTLTQIAALQDGKQRAIDNLKDAAALRVEGDVVEVFNLTGHKLISGYPEGRRMWLNVRWYDAASQLVREDGRYGKLNVVVKNQPLQVDTIVDLAGPGLALFDAQLGISQDWAAKLVTLGVPPGFPLSFDRVSGAVTKTLGQLASDPPGSVHHTFHFGLNNVVMSDTRIPPYGMSYDDAVERNAQPVPATQYGAPSSGEAYDHFARVTLAPPANAAWASVRLMYQPTSWEYVQFLNLANDGSNAFLADVGDRLLDAWLQTGMAAPVVMAEARWGSAAPSFYCTAKVSSLGCTPAIGYTGVPSASAGSGFYLTCSNVMNERVGQLRYSVVGPAAAPFAGGYRCVATPDRRAGQQNAGGAPSPADDCSGGFAFDFNEWIASGADPALASNVQVWAQWWGRDPGSTPARLQLSAGIAFVIEP